MEYFFTDFLYNLSRIVGYGGPLILAGIAFTWFRRQEKTKVARLFFLKFALGIFALMCAGLFIAASYQAACHSFGGEAALSSYKYRRCQTAPRMYVEIPLSFINFFLK